MQTCLTYVKKTHQFRFGLPASPSVEREQIVGKGSLENDSVDELKDMACCNVLENITFHRTGVFEKLRIAWQ